MNLWIGTLIGVPLWWCLGLNLVFYHFLSLVLFIGVIHTFSRANRVIHIPESSFFILFILATYCFSILIHGSSSNFSRVVAAGYNLSFWAMGFMLVLVLTNLYSTSMMHRFLSTFAILAFISGIITLMVGIAYLMGVRSIRFATPFYGLSRWIGQTVLVENSLVVKLLEPGWFVSVWRPRLNLFSPYPTATGGTLMIILMMLMTWAFVKQKIKSVSFAFLFMTNLLALFMTFSRMSVMAFLMSCFLIFLMQRKMSLSWLMLSIVLILAMVPVLQIAVGFLLGAREGSNISRMDLYLQSIRQLQGVDWILGMGLKPRQELFDYPLGSHSTYISLLFKTGITGFFGSCRNR